VTTGHLLVVPRAHAESLETLAEDLGARQIQAAADALA
jgi:diadenosine tetraphosphate (Ap4A) HIT family hydrolase